MPPRPRIAIAPAAVAKFKYAAECVTNRCLGHPYKGPLYYSLGIVGTLLAYRSHGASGVGTSQEGEAMVLLSYVRRLAEQPRVY